MAELERVQVLLTRAQRRALAKIARREGHSVSAILREMIERGLGQRAKEEQQWQGALVHLRQIRQAHSRRGIYEGDLVGETRAERERQLESGWHRLS